MLAIVIKDFYKYKHQHIKHIKSQSYNTSALYALLLLSCQLYGDRNTHQDYSELVWNGIEHPMHALLFYYQQSTALFCFVLKTCRTMTSNLWHIYNCKRNLNMCTEMGNYNLTFV